MWIYSPPKRPKPKVPDDVKAAVIEKAEYLLEEWRPRHIKPPSPGYQFNYIVELYGKWFRPPPQNSSRHTIRGGHQESLWRVASLRGQGDALGLNIPDRGWPR